MKLSTVIVSVSVAGAVVLAAGQFASAARQPEKQLKDKVKEVQKGVEDKVKAALPAQPADEQKMMEEMAKAAQPGAEHKRMASMVGTWDCECTMYMPGADGKVEAHKSKAEAVCTSELDGRWIRQEFKGTFMDAPFSGVGYNGYDNVTKKYVGTWMDTWMTGMVSMTGAYDEATKTLTMSGTCQMAGMGEVKSRYVTVEKDANTVEFTMYNTRMGMPETKDGVIIYKRRK